MKIAIPTNDRKNVAERTGQASEFVVFTIENRNVIQTEYRKNTHTHEPHAHGHTENHSHDDVIDILKDIDMFYVRKVGPHMTESLEEGKIPYTILDQTFTVSEVVAKYADL